MKTSILLAVCAAVVLYATWEGPMFLLSEYPVVTGAALVAGVLFFAVGLIRGERLSIGCVRNLIPLIVGGLVSLILVTLLRGSDHFVFVVAAGVVCFGASVALVVLEKSRRWLAAGLQTIILLYVWGLTPYWVMGVRDDWL